MTDALYATDAYLAETDATVIDLEPENDAVLLDQTVLYPGGGGQPHDTGELIAGEDRYEIVEVYRKGRSPIWHVLEDDTPSLGDPVRAVVDWDRRYALMRTHTALHALCGVMWERFRAPVTGGDMKPGEGRLDFELPDWDPDDREWLEEELNRQLQLDRQVEVDYVSRDELERDPSLIRTKASLLPAWLETIRVIDIVGLDRQADGGTHVASTGEVGRVAVTKVESKGSGSRRIRLALVDEESEEQADPDAEEEPAAAGGSQESGDGQGAAGDVAA